MGVETAALVQPAESSVAPRRAREQHVGSALVLGAWSISAQPYSCGGGLCSGHGPALPKTPQSKATSTHGFGASGIYASRKPFCWALAPLIPPKTPRSAGRHPEEHPAGQPAVSRLVPCRPSPPALLSLAGAVAVAEFIAESPRLLRLDLRENEIKTGGLMALSLALKVNHSLLRLDLDREPKKESVGKRPRSPALSGGVSSSPHGWKTPSRRGRGGGFLQVSLGAPSGTLPAPIPRGPAPLRIPRDGRKKTQNRPVTASPLGK